MISELAISDIEDLESHGLHPSPRDIVRLNALGLLIERAKDAGDIYALPRVAYLGRLSFREPTIAHSLWIERVLTYVNRKDFATFVAVNAYALAHVADVLPDATERDRAVDAIDAFTKNELAPFTFAQVSCAVTYALHGADQVALEYPEPPEAEGKADEIAQLVDPPRAVGCGIICETLAMGLGVSVRDIMGLTVSGVRKLQNLALVSKGIGSGRADVSRAQAEYFRTLEAVERRLKSETEKNNGSEQH